MRALLICLIASLMMPLSSPAFSEPPAAAASYSLNDGDKVRITVFGEKDMSGEFLIDSRGNLTMPLLGEVPARGKSPADLQAYIASKLAEGYLVNPKVSAEVLSYQRFYIVGEVQNPGAYDYVPSLNVLKAVAIAGGFTHRAVKDDFTIIRGEGEKLQKIPAREESVVLPGDSIRVDERFF